MREIKFRVWDGIKFSYWNLKEQGSQIYFINIGTKDNPKIVFPTIGKQPFAEAKDIQEFTGLHDKNGKEIWEGDIVQHYSYNYAEEYVPFVDEVKFQDGAFYPVIEMPAKEFEVLGNIYENPELLK